MAVNNSTMKVEVSLPESVIAQLQLIARERGISATEALEQIVSEHKYFRDWAKRKVLLLRGDDHALRQVEIK